jgi:hypothetical protein
MLDQDIIGTLSCFDIEDIIEYVEEEGFKVVARGDFEDVAIEYLQDEGYSIISEGAGLYLTDQQLGDIHMLAYSGQREEAIKEILALVVPAITINTKVLS